MNCNFLASNATGVTVKENSKDGTSTTQINNPVEAISNEEENVPLLNPDENDTRILIKLKYLNDTLKEVEGNLDELLKDFKT